MIINRYLIREIVHPLIIGCSLLVAIFASYSSATHLADAASGLIAPDIVLNLILLKTLIGFEVLLPTALYLSVVIGLGRLYSHSEITAMTALGVSSIHVLKTVLLLAIVVSMMVCALSLYARPWAYRLGYQLEAKAETQLVFGQLEAGRFYELKHTQRVLFAEHIDPDHNRMAEVFFQSRHVGRTRVIYAKEAYLPSIDTDAPLKMVFVNGYGYDLDQQGPQDMSLKFGLLVVHLDGYGPADVEYKRQAQSTASLAHSDKPKDIAEFQWRLSMPIATILMAVLAVPLSHTAPGQGRYARILAAVVVYAIYYNLAGMARTWIEEGWVGAVPGMWWIQGLPVTLLVLFLWRHFMVWLKRW